MHGQTEGYARTYAYDGILQQVVYAFVGAVGLVVVRGVVRCSLLLDRCVSSNLTPIEV